MFECTKIFSFSPEQHILSNSEKGRLPTIRVYFRIGKDCAVDLVDGSKVLGTASIDHNVLVSAIRTTDISNTLAKNVLFGVFWEMAILPNLNKNLTEFAILFNNHFPGYVKKCVGPDGNQAQIGLPGIKNDVSVYSFSPNSFVNGLYKNSKLPENSTVNFEFTETSTCIVFVVNGVPKHKFSVMEAPLPLTAIQKGALNKEFAHKFLSDYIDSNLVLPIVQEHGPTVVSESFNKIWPEFSRYVLTGLARKRGTFT